MDENERHERDQEHEQQQREADLAARERPLRPLSGEVDVVLRKLEALRAKHVREGTLPQDAAQPDGELCAEHRRVHLCTVCHDMHFVLTDLPGDPPRRDAIPCPGESCAARRQERLVRTLGETEISELGNARFGAFYPRSWQRPAYDLARDFAARRPPHGMLYLLGKNGCGKTHLAAAVGHAVVEAGFGALFYRTTTLLSRLRETYNPHDDTDMTYVQFMQRLRDVQVLVLDDFGQERLTEWAKEAYFDLLDYRYVHAREKATVITSNRPVPTLQDSLESRFSDVRRSQVCVLLGSTDLRLFPSYHDRQVQPAHFDEDAVVRTEYGIGEETYICHVCSCLPCHPACPRGRLWGDWS